MHFDYIPSRNVINFTSGDIKELHESIWLGSGESWHIIYLLVITEQKPKIWIVLKSF